MYLYVPDFRGRDFPDRDAVMRALRVLLSIS